MIKNTFEKAILEVVNLEKDESNTLYQRVASVKVRWIDSHKREITVSCLPYKTSIEQMLDETFEDSAIINIDKITIETIPDSIVRIVDIYIYITITSLTGETGIKN